METTPAGDTLLRGDLSALTTYQAGVLQAAVHRILQKHFDTILRPYGITKMHWLIIGTVLDAGTSGIRLTDLAKQVNTTMSYITTAVNLLETKGMLQREDNETDSRSKMIAINPAFISQCSKIEATLRETLRETIYARIDPADFRIYLKVLLQLTQVDAPEEQAA